MENQKFYYDNKIVKLFILATIIWGVVAVLVGVPVLVRVILSQLLSLADGAVGTLARIGENELGAIGDEGAFAL